MFCPWNANAGDREWSGGSDRMKTECMQQQLCLFGFLIKPSMNSFIFSKTTYIIFGSLSVLIGKV